MSSLSFSKQGVIMTRLQVYLHVEYQIVGGKGGVYGHIRLTRRGSHITPLLGLESQFAQTIAKFFAPEQAAKAKKEAEDDGPPVFVFEGTFNHDAYASPPLL